MPELGEGRQSVEGSQIQRSPATLGCARARVVAAGLSRRISCFCGAVHYLPLRQRLESVIPKRREKERARHIVPLREKGDGSLYSSTHFHELCD